MCIIKDADSGYPEIIILFFIE